MDNQLHSTSRRSNLRSSEPTPLVLGPLQGGLRVIGEREVDSDYEVFVGTYGAGIQMEDVDKSVRRGIAYETGYETGRPNQLHSRQ